MQAKTGEGEVEPKKATGKNAGLFQYANLTTSDHVLSEGRVWQMDIPAQSTEEDISQVTFVADNELGK